MGYIGNQFRLGPLAFHLLGHCFLKALLNPAQLFLKRVEDSQILLNLHIQVSLCYLIDTL